MDEQDAIERKSFAQEIGATSEIDGNDPDFVTPTQRRRKLSGPGSEGEKSLIKKDPVWLVSPKSKIPVFNSCLCSLDEVVATPSFNVSVIESACDQDFKFFDAINKSKYVLEIDGALAGLGLFSAAMGIYVIKYCKLREIERNSNYFYFSRLFKAFNAGEIENKMGEIAQDNPRDPITYEYLRAAAYFYPPDISKIACRRRRIFASGKKREQLKKLDRFLQRQLISEEEMLNKLHKRITEKVCQLLNKEATSRNFQIKEDENNWSIGLTTNYAENFFNHVDHLIKKNSETILEENINKKNNNYIPPILAALGQTSFIYWILMFIFCFISFAPVVTAASISVIPLGIAFFIALPTLLIIKIQNTFQVYNNNEKMTAETIEKQHKQMLEKKLVLLNKQNVFLNFLQNKNVNLTVKLKDSSLMKDAHSVITKRRFSKYHAICMGFLDGCFLPLFVGWLFLDGTKVILTYAFCPAGIALTSFTPIGLVVTAIIAGATLLIGISYGIYSAYKANKAHEIRFDELQTKIKVLEAERGDKEILEVNYKRALERFSNALPIWTDIKKGLNRFMSIIKRLGTGSLVFRLVMWGPITAIYAAVVASTAVPAFFPIILIIGTAIGAFIVASWYLYSYNLESKATRTEKAVEYYLQSEQLDDINDKLPKTIFDECLDIHESSNEIILVPSENLAKSENDTPFTGQENVSSLAENNNSAEVDAVITHAKTNIQSNNSNSSSHGLFKNNTQIVENGNENMVGLSTAFSC
jgi:hypothetical protein